ncbi:MAG: hypothetical protein CL608_20895 [Anaerolineaceae bacterium]|nr:hypothetical protein [Anaerolineaceae bacterium]
MMMRLRLLLLALAGGLCLLLALLHLLRPFPTSHALANEIYCVVPAGDATGPFPICDQVFDSIQAAVDTAVGGEEIRVAAGLYTDVQTRSGIEQIVFLDKNVSLAGGYLPPFTAVPDPIANPTTLDAQNGGRVIYVLTDTISTISGLHLTGGNASGQGNGFGSCSTGGGLFGTGAILTLTQNIISGNLAEMGSGLNNSGCGGGLAFHNGSLTMLENTVQNNTAAAASTGTGGGIYINNSNYLLQGNEIVGNTAVTSGGGAHVGFGGGLILIDSSGTLSHNNIIGNQAVLAGDFGYGGGIYIARFNDEPATVLLNNNLIQENVALVQPSPSGDPNTTYAGDGGGLYLLNYEEADANFAITMTQNEFLSNTSTLTGSAGLAGGLFMSNRSPDGLTSLHFSHNLVAGNTAVYSSTSPSLQAFGGGLIMGRLDATLRHNRYISNTAIVSGTQGLVGGVYIYGGEALLQNEILQGNAAVQSGGGDIGGLGLEAATATLENVVLIDNQAAETGGLWIIASAVTVSHPTIARNGTGKAVTIRDPSVVENGPAVPSTVTLTNVIIAEQSMGIHVEANNSMSATGVLWHMVPTPTVVGPLATFTISQQQVGNPAFAADGYHITESSAARFAGVASPVLLDVDGEGRPSPPSLGADEYWTNRLLLPLVFR